jgi:transcription initiation factor TFIID TATA-box-binding protein
VPENKMRKRRFENEFRKSKFLNTLAETFHSESLVAEYLNSLNPEERAKKRTQAQIHNIVGTAQIESSCTPLDLVLISKIMPNVKFDQKKFAALTIRLASPCCTVLLFTSGKMVLTGCNTFAECILASLQVVSYFRKRFAGISIILKKVVIQNIVGNVDLKLPGKSFIDLERIYEENGVMCTFQRNMFPGLIYRPDNCSVVLLLFNSGKIVVTGAKSALDIHDGWKSLWPFVRKYVVVR